MKAMSRTDPRQLQYSSSLGVRRMKFGFITKIHLFYSIFYGAIDAYKASSLRKEYSMITCYNVYITKSFIPTRWKLIDQRHTFRINSEFHRIPHLHPTQNPSQTHRKRKSAPASSSRWSSTHQPQLTQIERHSYIQLQPMIMLWFICAAARSALRSQRAGLPGQARGNCVHSALRIYISYRSLADSHRLCNGANECGQEDASLLLFSI